MTRAPKTPRGILRTAIAVAAKELRSSMRDRQTMIYTVVLPLAMYPTIFWIMLQGATFLQGRDELTGVRVGVAGTPSGIAIEELATGLEAQPEEPSNEAEPVLESEQAPRLRYPGPLTMEVLGAPPRDEVARREILAPEEGDPAFDVLLVFGAETQLVFDSTQSQSVLAADRVRERLTRLVETTRQRAVNDAGHEFDELRAFDVALRNLASERDLGGYIFSLMLPMMFVFMSVMGAFFPAVDTTAGEKERGTAETTLLLPVPRVGIHLGKVLAVFTAACVATILNIVGMALAAEHLLAGISRRAFSIEIPWSALASAVPLCAIFLFMVSAILVAGASLTKTFKQGQSLLGTVQMVFFVPAFISVIPTLKLTVGLALVPVIQTVLAMRALLQATGPGETLPLLELSLVAVTQLIYAALAIYFSVWLSSRESLRLGAAGRLLPRFRKRKPAS